jgi:hypothetical protein
MLVLLLILATTAGQQAEKHLVLTITGTELKGGILSEVTWDGGVIVLQGVFAEPTGELKAQYFVQPAEGTQLDRLTAQSDESLRYWRMKASRISPTGFGRIEIRGDTQMPQFGIGSLQRRINEAVEMGGTQTKSQVRLGALVIHERPGEAPYDGEVWSWSPPALNRVAYVDAKGDLWVARADGGDPQRIMRGDFTLPAWSDDGRSIAIAERKDGGRRWDVSIIYLPQNLMRPRVP